MPHLILRWNHSMGITNVNMKDIVVYGAGGLGREVAALIKKINQEESKWNFLGFIDDSLEKVGKTNEYGSVLGGIDFLNNYQTPLSVVVSVGSPEILKGIVEKISNLQHIDFPNIIAPSASFLDESNVRMGKGNIICSNCFISCNVTLGDFNILNGCIPIGHDATLGNYNVIMPSCNISGGDIIGDCNFFGVQSVVLQYLKIGNNTRIGANSVVMKNTEDGYLYFGNPARKLDL